MRSHTPARSVHRHCATLTNHAPCHSTNCTTGNYAASIGSSSCAECTAGRFADQKGETSCAECVAGTYSHQGAAFCDACDSGTYSDGEQRVHQVRQRDVVDRERVDMHHVRQWILFELGRSGVLHVW